MLIARHSGLVLDVANASTASGTPIGQFFNNGQKNQQFAMIRLG